MRKMIGVSEALHQELKVVSEELKLPMTVVIRELLVKHDQLDWKEVKERYKDEKPTWANMRKRVQEYQIKYPKASDKKLVSLTGFSILQIETITHSAHRRCIQYLRDNKNASPSAISRECEVTPAFAVRIRDQFKGRRKIPKSETYLFKE